MPSLSQLEVRPLCDDDLPRLLERYNASRPGELPPRTRAELDWATRANPAGHRSWLGLQGDAVVAHFATRPHRVVTDGEERVFSLVSDARVFSAQAEAPTARPSEDAAPEVSTLVETARALLAATAGPGGDLMSYGWLAPDVWTALRVPLRFEMVRMQTLLQLPSAPAPAPAEPSGASAFTLEALERFGDDAHELYERCRGPWGASTVRDARFLNWRFVDGPRTYDRFALRDAAGALLGLAVLRIVPWPAQPSCLVGDWLVPDDEPGAGRALLSHVRAHARARGATRVIATFPEWSPWFRRWQDWGARVTGSDLLMASRKTFPRQEAYWLKDHWWYQPADLDLV